MREKSQLRVRRARKHIEKIRLERRKKVVGKKAKTRRARKKAVTMKKRRTGPRGRRKGSTSTRG